MRRMFDNKSSRYAVQRLTFFVVLTEMNGIAQHERRRSRFRFLEQGKSYWSSLAKEPHCYALGSQEAFTAV